LHAADESPRATANAVHREKVLKQGKQVLERPKRLVNTSPEDEVTLSVVEMEHVEPSGAHWKALH